MSKPENEARRQDIRNQVVNILGEYYKTNPDEITNSDLVYKHGTKIIWPSPADKVAMHFEVSLLISDKLT